MSANTALAWVGCVGLTQILTAGAILQPVRTALSAAKGGGLLGALVSCPTCAGFWIGIAAAEPLGLAAWEERVCWGGAVSVVSQTVDLLQRRLRPAR